MRSFYDEEEREEEAKREEEDVVAAAVRSLPGRSATGRYDVVYIRGLSTMA